MTLDQAKELIQRPKFGDPQTIIAAKLIESYQRATEIRSLLAGKLCLACDGEGDHDCKCGDWHHCGTCDGTGLLDGEETSTNVGLLDDLRELTEFIDRTKQERICSDSEKSTAPAKKA